MKRKEIIKNIWELTQSLEYEISTLRLLQHDLFDSKTDAHMVSELMRVQKSLHVLFCELCVNMSIADLNAEKEKEYKKK